MKPGMRDVCIGHSVQDTRPSTRTCGVNVDISDIIQVFDELPFLSCSLSRFHCSDILVVMFMLSIVIKGELSSAVLLLLFHIDFHANYVYVSFIPHISLLKDLLYEFNSQHLVTFHIGNMTIVLVSIKCIFCMK